MWKPVKALFLGLGLLFAVSAGSPLLAQTTTKTPLTTSWQSLGGGPLYLSTIGQAWYAVSPSTPSLVQEGFPVPDGGVPVNTAGQIWARVADTGVIATAYTYPIVAGTFTGSFAWPGSAGNGIVGAPAAGGTTAPYVNSYIVGTLPAFAATPTFNCGTGCGSGTFIWPGSAGNGVIGAAAGGGTTAPYVNAYVIGGGSSASATAFRPGPTPISGFNVTSTGTVTSIPTGTTTLLIGSGASSSSFLHCTLGAGPATTSDLTINPGVTVAFDATGATQFACIVSSGTQLVNAVAGQGQFQATGASSPTVSAVGTTSNQGQTVQGNVNGVPIPVSSSLVPVSHADSNALGAALIVKASAGALTGYNCTAITGGTAGYCIAYNSATTPTGSSGVGTPLNGSLVLDFCYFDSTARGCALGRAPTSVAYSAGIQILISSAVTPFTYTTGVDTGALSADFQ